MGDLKAPEDRLDKDEVNYRQHERCGTCANFVSPNACLRVEGTISPDAVCDLWTLKESKGTYNKEFFVRKAKESGKVKEE